MRKNKKVKRSVTLIEIMIVLVLIGIIGGALAYNMRGGLERGKKFQTEQNIARVYDILMMEYSKGAQELSKIAANYEEIVQKSEFAKNPDKLLKDGWGKALKIKYDKVKDELQVTSDNL
jgi:type II secretory pathway pseudopilin PulG